jgi:hypothetical protein
MLNEVEKKNLALAIYLWYKLTAKNRVLNLLSVQAILLARLCGVEKEYEEVFRKRNPNEKIVSFTGLTSKEEFLKTCEELWNEFNSDPDETQSHSGG